MTTKSLTGAQRKRAKRAQRRYRKLSRSRAVLRSAAGQAMNRRLDRLSYLGWNHLNTTIIESLNRSVQP